MKYYLACPIVFLLLFLTSCGDDPKEIDLTDIDYNPIPVVVEGPPKYPGLNIPTDNPLTEAGIHLGRSLFYDPILSIDNSISCASCHKQEASFTDELAFSLGVDDKEGRRSSMNLVDVGYSFTPLFWDGRAETLEDQALLPVEDPNEMAHTWEEIIKDFQTHANYPRLFRAAFGIENSSQITKELAAKSIAQFERTLVSSGNSKYDQVLKGQDVFTDEEAMGFDIYFDRSFDLPDGQCFHCHSAPQFTDYQFHNNGLDVAEVPSDFPDFGRGEATGIPAQNGTFKTPTLRNIALTAPYMHDGRFSTLEEVMDHYISGGHPSFNKSPLLDSINLNSVHRNAVLAFLHTLTDEDFVNNEAYSDPN